MDADGERYSVDIKKIIVGGLVSLALSLSCIWIITRVTGTESLRVNISTIGRSTILLSLLMVVASWVVDSLKLKILTSAMGGHIGLWDALKITVAGSFIAGITPFDSGGEPLKVYFLHKRDLGIGSATAVVTLGALLHGISRFILWLVSPILLLLTGTSLVFSSTAKTTIAIGVFLYVLLMGLVIAMALWPQWVEIVTEKLFGMKAIKKLVPQSLVTAILDKVETSVREFRDGMSRVKESGRHAVIALLLSVLYWLFVISVPVLLVRSMVPQVPYAQVFFVTMTVYLIMAFIPTPGSSGGAEAGSAYFFSSILPSRLLGGFVIVWRIVTYYFTMLAGAIVVAMETINWSMNKSQPSRVE